MRLALRPQLRWRRARVGCRLVFARGGGAKRAAAGFRIQAFPTYRPLTGYIIANARIEKKGECRHHVGLMPPAWKRGMQGNNIYAIRCSSGQTQT